MASTVNTVLGPIGESELGVTYVHEHLCVMPDERLSSYPYTLDSIDNSVEEACRFRDASGRTIVEMTPIGYGRNVEVLREISRRSRVNVVCVTGFHKQEFLPKWFSEESDSELLRLIVHEVEEGIGWSCVLPGAIKVGTSLNQITPDEKRAITLCGAVARDCDLPIISHCDKGTMGLEQLELLEKVGVSLDRVCLSHVDLTMDVDYLKRLCDRGAYLSFDHVGRELEDHDARRLEMLAELVRCEYGAQVCLAGDMGKRDYFVSYGGKPGLDYILTDFRVHALEVMGADDFRKMVVDNPCRLLAG